MAVVDGKIRCSGCHGWKPMDQFMPSVVKAGHGPCRSCNAEKSRARYRANGPNVREQQRVLRLADHPRRLAEERMRYAAGRSSGRNERSRLAQYGLTVAEFDAMFLAQSGRCACCGRKASELMAACRAPRRLHVDHCHATGAVRDLLCRNCNAGLGQFRDDPGLLRAAAAYIEKHQQMRRRPGLRINLTKESHHVAA